MGKQRGNAKKITAVLSKYAEQGSFEVIELDFNERLFGNIVIRLKTKSNIIVGIFRDSLQVMSALYINEVPNDDFYLDEILDVLGIMDKRVNLNTEIIEALDQIMKLISNNWHLLVQAFNSYIYSNDFNLRR